MRGQDKRVIERCNNDNDYNDNNIDDNGDDELMGESYIGLLAMRWTPASEELVRLCVLADLCCLIGELFSLCVCVCSLLRIATRKEGKKFLLLLRQLVEAKRARLEQQA